MSEFTVKLALFKSEYGTVVALKQALTALDNYVQISDYKEITFDPLPESTIIDNQIAALDAQAIEIEKKYNAAIEEIKTRKAQLLALPHMDEKQ